MSTKKLSCVMLIDDNPHDNFFHERVIRKAAVADQIVVMQNAEAALRYLADDRLLKPSIIFLDVNMPGMNGWEFLEAYQHLGGGMQQSIVVVMLTTSVNPDDQELSRERYQIADYIIKPLTAPVLDRLMEDHVSDGGVA